MSIYEKIVFLRNCAILYYNLKYYIDNEVSRCNIEYFVITGDSIFESGKNMVLNEIIIAETISIENRDALSKSVLLRLNHIYDVIKTNDRVSEYIKKYTKINERTN